MKDTASPVADGLLTLGQLAKRVRQDGVQATDHQVKYALDAYRIEPAGRIGRSARIARKSLEDWIDRNAEGGSDG